MKKKSSTAVLTPNPDTGVDPTEAVVDDLNQQDVLPSSEGGEAILDAGEDDDTALTQAGRWDDPASDLGHRASKQPLEDEIKASEDLVNMGVDEADEELRELDELDEEEEEKEDEK